MPYVSVFLHYFGILPYFGPVNFKLCALKMCLKCIAK